MTNPFQHASSSFPETTPSGSSSGLLPPRVSYANAASGVHSGSTPPYLSQPGRTSLISHLLNSADDSTPDTSANNYHNRGRSEMQQNGTTRSGRGARQPWPQSSQLPSLSKAFNLYMGQPAIGLERNSSSYAQGGGFLVPSYLRGSSYIQSLQESHRAKLRAEKEGQSSHDQAVASSTLPRNASSTSLHSKPSSSHRGISKLVVEKPPPLEEEQVVSPLPTKWNREDKHAGLDVLADGLEVRYNGPRGHSEKENEAYSIRADNYMPAPCGVYYFEVTILAGKRDDTTIGIGFSDKEVSLLRPPGWEPNSYGYHGDDGNAYVAHSSGKAYGPSFTSPDVIGCGINFRSGSAFFTKNGVLLGTAFRDVKGKFYPSVGLKKAGEHVRVNFGQSPFTYDIDGMMNATLCENLQSRRLPELHRARREVCIGVDITLRWALQNAWQIVVPPLPDLFPGWFEDGRLLALILAEIGCRMASSPHGRRPVFFDPIGFYKERDRVQREVSRANTSSLAPPLTNETELIQALVLQFLQHDGYVETARAFAEEVHNEKKALIIDPNAVVEGANVKDDEHATKRQRIRRAILEGDIDGALKHTDDFYPKVLNGNEQVYFRLRCQKFVEMIRKAAEMRIVGDDKKFNGHSKLDTIPQEMDLDSNDLDSSEVGNSTLEDDMDTEDGVDLPISLDELELDTLNFGQRLHAEFRDDPRREMTKALEDIFALMAYTNPLKEKDVAHLLDKQGRVAVAEELNSAILLSLGKSSRAALEELYAQTSVLLGDLRDSGGPGAFVSLQDVIDDIPKRRHL